MKSFALRPVPSIVAIAGISVALFAAGCMCGGGGGGGGENLMVCGGFERLSDLEKSPEGWFATVVPQYKDFVSFEWDDTVARSGEYCVSIAISPDHFSTLLI